MVALKCELCGSSELVKKDGLYECQHCKTKYTVEEAKKLIVQGEVTVKNIGDVDTYIKLARTARESKNFKDAENYSNKILELDIDNYEAWFIKGIAVGWQSTVANPRILETIKNFENSISHAPEETKEDLTKEAIDETKNLISGLINLGCSFYSDNPTDYNADTIVKTIKKIISDSSQFPFFTDKDVKDISTYIAKTVSSVIRTTFDRQILPDYYGDDKRPSKYQFNDFIKQAMYSVILDDLALGCITDNDKKDVELKIQILKDEIMFLEKRGSACSWTKEFLNGMEYWAKEMQLSKEAKQKNIEMINERKAKINELDPSHSVVVKETHDDSNQPNAKKSNKDVGWWIGFAIFIFGTLSSYGKVPIIGTIGYSIACLVCFPPLFNFLEKNNIKVPLAVRIVLLILPFIIVACIK